MKNLSRFLFLTLIAATSYASAANGPITCALQTYTGNYVTAVGGGGRVTDVIHTDATKIGSWEKFTLIDSNSGQPIIEYGIQTKTGNFLTAVGGGGRVKDVIHSNATQLREWEQFKFIALGFGIYAIQTKTGNYVTAVGGGGRITDTIHTDATQIGNWEKFRVICDFAHE